MKLSRTISYALQATLALAKNGTGEPIPCSRLAKEGQMPERFLLQILRNLVNHGILRSTRGVDGGYTLVRNPEDVSLLELIEAIDGPIDSLIPGAESMNEVSQYRLQNALDSITTTAREQLQAIKLTHLLPPPE